MNIFRNNMKKIFQIINLTYYNYYTSNDTDKKEISKKDLIDFNALLKKVDLNEINVSLQKINKDFSIEQPIFNFELQWDGEDYKKKYELKPKKDDDDKPDCVTKIIELNNVNKLVSSLINGQIYVWDLSAKKIDFSINAHKSAIWSMIKLSNDNIVSGSSDKMIKIWDILSGMSEPTIKLRGHKATVFCLGEIEKNKLLSGSEDRTIKLWDLEQKKCIMSLDDPNGSKINCLHILPDPGFIITGGDDNLLKIWNIYSDYVPNTLVGHECTIWSITSISDDDTQIASGSSDNTIKIWDLISLKCRFTLEGHENTISSLKLLNNGYLISSSWDKLINIWNLNTRNCIVSIKGHNNIVWDVIQLSDGDLASCSSDTKIIVWTKNNLNNN
jgi:WD40 repeat protein